MKTYFSTNSLFRVVETHFLSSWNRMLFSESFFLLLETMIEIRGNQFNRKIFSCYWKPFSIFFLPEEIVFSYIGNAFFNECFIPGSGNRFLPRANHKLFFRLMETYLLANPSFQLLKKDFLFSGSHLLYLSFFLLAETVTDMSRNHFLNTDRILAGANSFSS